MPHGYTPKSRCQGRTEMKGDPGAFKRLFPQKHIPIILSSILDASKLLKKKTEYDREDWITRRLHGRIIRLPAFRDGPAALSIQLQPEIPSMDLDSNTPGGRIDLLVPSDQGYQVYFAIEAKRLRFLSPGGQFKSGNDEYVKNGMMRFIKGRYAPLMENGAMLGYVFDGYTDTAMLGNRSDRRMPRRPGPPGIGPPLREGSGSRRRLPRTVLL